MKKSILFIAIVISIGFSYSYTNSIEKEITIEKTYSDFSKGFSDGWCRGFKSIKGRYAVCPIPPVAPVPPVGYNNYEGGYDIGFSKGVEKAKE